MNLFEYLTVAISIVLSMSIVRSLESFGDVVDPLRRDAIHLGWFALKAFQPALLWWSIWVLNAQTGWNFLAFLCCLGGPICLFFQITTLTTRRPEEVPDWGAHFMARRKRFFGAHIVNEAMPPALLAALGHDEAVTSLVGLAVGAVLATAGMATSDRRVHFALLAIAALGAMLGTIVLFEPVSVL